MTFLQPESVVYRHGDLPAALVRAAVDLVREQPGGALSLRAVARRAGVSSGAPYRHFADRRALMSAVAAVGYRDLAQRLLSQHAEPRTVADLADLGASYVAFALTEQGLFRAMFTEGCDPSYGERVDAVAAVHAFLWSAAERVFVGDVPDALATGLWATVHGLAFLYLDGKLDNETPETVAAQVRATVVALLTTQTA